MFYITICVIDRLKVPIDIKHFEDDFDKFSNDFH
jgi:hypothetical protein